MPRRGSAWMRRCRDDPDAPPHHPGLLAPRCARVPVDRRSVEGRVAVDGSPSLAPTSPAAQTPVPPAPVPPAPPASASTPSPPASTLPPHPPTASPAPLRPGDRSGEVASPPARALDALAATRRGVAGATGRGPEAPLPSPRAGAMAPGAGARSPQRRRPPAGAGPRHRARRGGAASERAGPGGRALGTSTQCRRSRPLLRPPR